MTTLYVMAAAAQGHGCACFTRPTLKYIPVILSPDIRIHTSQQLVIVEKHIEVKMSSYVRVL